MNRNKKLSQEKREEKNNKNIRNTKGISPERWKDL